METLRLPATLALLAVFSGVAFLHCVEGACNPASSTASSQIKVDPGKSGTSGTACYFPFTYSGVTYTDCIGDTGVSTPYTSPYCDGSYCNYWCATTCNYGTDSSWNYCKFQLSDLAKPNCSGLTTAATSAEPELYGGTGSGTACYFPFLYNGVCNYDCISTGKEPWCSTTDVVQQVDQSYKYCRYTLAGKNDASCSSLSSSTTYYIAPQTGNYSIGGLVQTDQYNNCTFPFYYKGKCYDDCTTVDATRWYLPWCSTEKYYQPNQKSRFCPYYRKYRSYTGLALSWGFYRIYLNDGCGSGGAYCNMVLSQAGAGVPLGTFGSPRMVISSTATTVFEVMPQGNGFFILRIPLPCASNFVVVTTDTSDVVSDYVSTEREFWNITATGTSGIYTIQSSWNATAGQYLTRSTSGGYDVTKILSSPASTWRFEQVSNSELSNLSLPCEDPVTNLNGQWCAWSSYVYSGASATRNRTCNCPPPVGSGANCTGASTDSGASVNGTWCEWSGYSASGAYGTRNRACNCSAPAFGGLDCPGSGNDTGLIVNAGWCAWSSFTMIGAYASRTRNCSCPEAAYGGSTACSGLSNDTGLPVNGTWCAWTGYSVSGAYGTRTRDCNCSAPAYAGLDCSGASNDTGLVLNGTWCAWSGYSVTGGYATRTRTCACSAEAYGGLTCQGSANDTGAVVDGVWCAWSAYTVTAGVGSRTRTCGCPTPAYAGASCSGSASDTLAQVNGTWCTWSSLASGYGVMTRTRACNCSAPNAIGYNCSGVSSEDYPCNVTDCQTTTPSKVDGGWCSWGSWVAGLANSGVMSRSRSCGCPTASGSGAACPGSTSEKATCTINGCQVFYAVPESSGTTGTSFTSSDTFNRLIIWCSVVGGCMIISTVIGLGLMLRQIARGGA